METALGHEYAVLQRGTVIADGHTVLRCTRKSERVVGSCYASWVVLCEAPADRHHKWVTWTVIAHETGWSAESGVYFQEEDYEQAYGNYEYRGGN